MKKIIETIQEDLHAAMTRDPAARSKWEVFWLYSGVHAILLHRIAHWLWENKIKFLARGLSQLSRFITGIEIHPGAKIGRGFFIDHGMGVVIGETAEVGENVTLYHGVTLGGVSIEKGKRHPTLRDNVVVGAGAKVLGAIEIGKGSRIGANAVVVKPVPSHSIVVGVPGHVIKRSQPMQRAADLNHDRLPDTVVAALKTLSRRVKILEQKTEMEPLPALQERGHGGNGSGRMTHQLQEAADIWYEDDFVI